ncbi:MULTISPECIES: thioesterase family protein [unclassified Mesorhizobium]|uniref:thioesterase family protein n=1 Tax=unclassified Mesorhizobium TaxID=325217 RepID=UPI000F754396|nr:MULTISPECIES: thioesterase family protein [unclassified Mesorhizobium]AZO26076.1 thioesterase [Mesorhizobium sp. M1B.F.Ca.ET.045.04.1.1]RWB14737.1 MAG: thioesterase [Mesorhizobium sp.]RWE00019.1 MAG: thioesterase [Mesorhizobium sp.]TIT91791.1 MAG: thioesterase [Mesorhizobium sp.]
MYVWGRLARMMATASSRGPYVVGEQSRLAFRCLPTDIDFNSHLNNARYMMLADLGRIDVFLRVGLVALARRNGWAPMIGGLQSAYVREIRLWRRFEVVSSIETWEGTSVIGKHCFVLDNGETAALIMTTGGVYDRRGRRFLEIGEVVAALGHSVQPRPPTEAERAFMISHKNLREQAKQV